MMPEQRPHRSEQEVSTPRDLLRAAEARFGPFAVDLAARRSNAKAPRYVTPYRNSLRISWSREFPGLLAWLNPEFADLEPWAAKCAAEKGLRIVMLTPASVGADWFADHVHQRAHVLVLRPRVRFEGHADPFPKDCMLSLWNFPGRRGFDLWRWKPERPKATSARTPARGPTQPREPREER